MAHESASHGVSDPVSSNPAELDVTVQRAVSGDEGAWAELDLMFRRRLLGYVRSRGVVGADADDVVQQSLITVWKRLHAYDRKRASLATWVYEITRYKLLDFFEQKGRLTELENLRADLDARPPGNEHEDLIDPQTLERWRSTSPDLDLAGRMAVAVAFERAIVAVFDHACLPHQSLTFGFVRLLEWRPEEVVTDLSPDVLVVLAGRLEDDLRRSVGLPQLLVQRALRPLRADLERPLGTLMTHWRQRDRWPTLLERVTGTIRYEEYYGEEPAIDVVRWWESCLRGTRAKLADAEAAS